MSPFENVIAVVPVAVPSVPERFQPAAVLVNVSARLRVAPVSSYTEMSRTNVVRSPASDGRLPVAPAVVVATAGASTPRDRDLGDLTRRRRDAVDGRPIRARPHRRW